MNARRRPVLGEVRFRHGDEHVADRAGRRVCERIFRIHIALAVRKPSSHVTQGRPRNNESVRGFAVAAKPKYCWFDPLRWLFRYAWMHVIGYYRFGDSIEDRMHGEVHALTSRNAKSLPVPGIQSRSLCYILVHSAPPQSIPRQDS